MLTAVFKGEPRLFLPHEAKAITEGYVNENHAPVLSILVPIRNESGSITAVLMLRNIGLEEQYQKLIDSWGSGMGETYLIDSAGYLRSPSRYQGERLTELSKKFNLVDSQGTFRARDPGVNLLTGGMPANTPASWAPTYLAGQLTNGIDGFEVDGYRNYVGELVVGAWRWIPDHQIGIALEEHAADALGVEYIARNALLFITGLFSLTLVGLALVSAFLNSSRKRLRDISDVGPYQVQEMLGEGGMGRVYLAEHALLCRQSAVKVLTGGETDLTVISRFEREVQLASQLTHPNTIAIYDFGRNKDGIFYYAMEYINGAHLGQLIEYTGPLHPGRCIYILQQLCRALNEAHQAGVVHRDIKPQNIMVCNRGGEPDFVKLFDYGLVKAFAPGVSHTTSQTKVVVGTPRFMAPERLNSPWLADPRVDIYSVGALAYFLLTGKLPPLVAITGPMDNEQPGIETLDLPAGVVEFGELLSICLSVEPASRPSSMQSLMRDLDELAEKFPWSREDSIVWWSKHEAKLLHLVKNKRKKLDAGNSATSLNS